MHTPAPHTFAAPYAITPIYAAGTYCFTPLRFDIAIATPAVCLMATAAHYPLFTRHSRYAIACRDAKSGLRYAAAEVLRER